MNKTIPKRISNKFASWFTGTCLNGVRHPRYGSNQVTHQQIKYSPGEYKTALYKEIKEALKNNPDNAQLWMNFNELG